MSADFLRPVTLLPNPALLGRGIQNCLRVIAFMFGIGWIAGSLVAYAHIGDQTVFFEGQAGAYPVRIVVRPPGVIPGLAEISVRVATNGVERVTVLPIRWSTGRQGAPPPDEAKPVRGETNLYSGELWFMRDGAQSVEVAITGPAGEGKVIVPVNAVATRVLGMPTVLGWLLGLLGLILVAFAASIVGAAVRESILPAGLAASARRRAWARATIGIALVLIVGVLWLGQRWWSAEARSYRNNRLFRPIDSTAGVRFENGQRILTLECAFYPRGDNGPLVPEHGKLMHLFLIREPGLDVFAHLHPQKRDWKTFEALLPELPAGSYRIYADVTYESGFTDTLTAITRLPAPENPAPNATTPSGDSDDAWTVGKSLPPIPSDLLRQTNTVAGYTLELSVAAPLVENRDTDLRLIVRDALSQTAPLESFMGMNGHLILRRDDGTVFTHLHPSGSFSMAAQQLFTLRLEGKAPMKIASPDREPICQLPAMTASAATRDALAFPYAFPRMGNYRLWAQVKVGGRLITGVFDVRVAPPH